MRIPLRSILYIATITCGTVVLVVGIGYLAQAYVLGKRIESQLQSQATQSVVDRSQFPFTIISIDPDSFSMIIEIPESRVIGGQTIRMQVILASNALIEKRDPILRNGVFIGSKPSTKISIQELSPGMQGIGVARLMPNGTTVMNRILIGSPFVRP